MADRIGCRRDLPVLLIWIWTQTAVPDGPCKNGLGARFASIGLGLLDLRAA